MSNPKNDKWGDMVYTLTDGRQVTMRGEDRKSVYEFAMARSREIKEGKPRGTYTNGK